MHLTNRQYNTILQRPNFDVINLEGNIIIIEVVPGWHPVIPGLPETLHGSRYKA